VSDRIADNWPTVCKICTQAQRFDDELRAALDLGPSSSQA
jgi:hypothetical protein